MFEKHAADAGEFIEVMDRPSDHAARLPQLVNERGAPDVDVDRIGKAKSQFGHVLRAGDDHGVIAGRPGIEERHRVEAEEISVGRRIGVGGGRVGGGAVAHKRRRIEGQQHGYGAGGDIGEALAGRAIELRHHLRHDHRFRYVERVELHGDRVPIDVGGGDARALHVLRGRGHDAGGEREARNSESQHGAPHLAGAVAATSGHESSIAVAADSAK